MDNKKIEHFHKILLLRRQQILKNILGSTEEIFQLNNLELNDELDHANVDSDKAIDRILSKQQSKELDEIEHALFKFNQTNFGRCEECKKYIPIKRLNIKPHARFCITCREVKEGLRG